MNEKLIRQSDLIPESILGTPISIVGAGAIGSFTTLALAKMGFYDIRVIDFDKVSVENMCCQLYRPKDIGTSKVIALQDIIKDYTDANIVPHDLRWEAKDGAFERGVVIAAVDSMAVRKEIYETHRDKRLGSIFWVDPRMGAESIQVHALKLGDKESQKQYEKTLYTDDSAVAEPCTAKATMYTALSVSGAIVSVLKAYLTGKEYHNTMYWSVPANDMKAFSKVNSAI